MSENEFLSEQRSSSSPETTPGRGRRRIRIRTRIVEGDPRTPGDVEGTGGPEAGSRKQEAGSRKPEGEAEAGSGRGALLYYPEEAPDGLFVEVRRGRGPEPSSPSIPQAAATTAEPDHRRDREIAKLRDYPESPNGIFGRGRGAEPSSYICCNKVIVFPMQRLPESCGEEEGNVVESSMNHGAVPWGDLCYSTFVQDECGARSGPQAE